MAGIYEIWRDPTKDRDDDSAWLRTCSVITTEATDAAGHIHDRMPMVIRREAVDAWLDPGLTDPEQALRLLAVTEADALEAYAVSTEVNSVQNNDPVAQANRSRTSRTSPTTPAEPGPRTRCCEHVVARSLSVDTPQGPGAVATSTRPRSRRAVLVLGHGAGGGVNAADLELLARRLPRARRHRGAVRAAVADRRPQGRARRRPSSTRPGWPRSAGSVDQPWTPGPLFVGGRSAGARVACRTADRRWRRRRRLPGVPAAPARPARRSPGPPSCSPRRAAAGAAGDQGQLRHAGGDPRGDGRGARDPPGRAARGRPRLPGGQGRVLHRGRPAARWSTEVGGSSSGGRESRE